LEKALVFLWLIEETRGKWKMGSALFVKKMSVMEIESELVSA
jgi:hypothetical protein